MLSRLTKLEDLPHLVYRWVELAVRVEEGDPPEVDVGEAVRPCTRRLNKFRPWGSAGGLGM